MDSLEKNIDTDIGYLQHGYNKTISEMEKLGEKIESVHNDLYTSIKTVLHVAEDLSTHVYGRKFIELIP